jgi:uncharacterized BrkB/YihY/UPF0761 family membrane protein
MARLLRLLLPTFRFWFETEPHVYAISISAFALLSFFPFLIVMVSSFVYVLKWTAAVDAVFLALRDYFPDELGTFVRLNLMATVWQRGPAQFVSLILLLLTANGIFMPLEVALNKLWRVPANRSYLKNQLISIALIFLSGGAAVLSILLTAANQQFIRDRLGVNPVSAFFTVFFFKASAIPLTIGVLFLIYWKLPNAKLPAAVNVQAAIYVGLALEALKYLYLLVWPWLIAKLAREYGPFKYSVSLILFGFFAAMLVLAGAEWASRTHREKAAGQQPTSPLGLAANS